MMMSQAIFSLPLKLGTDCGTTVATPVINYLIAALDRRQHYSDFFVDISKAFDSVDDQLLMKKKLMINLNAGFNPKAVKHGFAWLLPWP